MGYLLLEAEDQLGRFAFVIADHESNRYWQGLGLRGIGQYADKVTAIVALVDLVRRADFGSRSRLLTLLSTRRDPTSNRTGKPSLATIATHRRELTE